MLLISDAINFIDEINKDLNIHLCKQDFSNKCLQRFFKIDIIENIVTYTFEVYEGSGQLVLRYYSDRENEYYFNSITVEHLINSERKSFE
jgi:hypothetical protein